MIKLTSLIYKIDILFSYTDINNNNIEETNDDLDIDELGDQYNDCDIGMKLLQNFDTYNS